MSDERYQKLVRHCVETIECLKEEDIGYAMKFHSSHRSKSEQDMIDGYDRVIAHLRSELA